MSSTPFGTSGTYAKGTQYAQPASRALLMDSVFHRILTFGVTGTEWKYQPEGPSRSPPARTRRGSRSTSTATASARAATVRSPSRSDGHAASTSAREAWRAMRFE